MNANENRHAVLAPGEGEVLEAGGNRLLIKVASPSQFLCEYTAPPYFAGPPLHVHPGFDETFLVLEGQLEVTVNDEPAELAPGAAAYVSGDVPHTFRNPGGDRARFLLVCSPGGSRTTSAASSAPTERPSPRLRSVWVTGPSSTPSDGHTPSAPGGTGKQP